MLTPWCSLSWKCDSCSSGQDIQHLYGPITTSPLHHFHNSPPLQPILSYLSQVHTITTCFSRTILLSPSHLHLYLPKGLFPWGFQTIIVHAFLVSATCTATIGPSHLPWHNHHNISHTEYKLWRSSLLHSLHPPVTSLSYQNILK